MTGCISSISVLGATTTKVTMPVTNPSFEEGLDGWRFVAGNSGMVSFETELVYHQDTSIKVVDPASDKPFELESIKMSAAENVTYQVKVRAFQTGRTTSSAYAYLNFYDASGNRLSERPGVSIGYRNFTSFEDFAEFTAEGKAPKGTKFVSVSLQTTSTYIGTVYFDHVRLWGITTSDTSMSEGQVTSADADALNIEYVAGEDETSLSNNVELPVFGANGSMISWESTNPSVVDGFGTVNPQNEAQEVTLTAKLQFGTSTKTKTFNLHVNEKVKSEVEINDSLLNPDFEKGMEDWSLLRGNKDSVNIEAGKDSEKSLKMEGHSSLIMMQSEPIFGEKGLEFALNADVLVEKGTANIELRFYNRDNKIVGTETKKLNATKEWTVVQMFKAAFDQTAYARIVLYPDQNSSFQIDNISISNMGYLLPNKGFEDGLDGYTITEEGNPSVSVDQEIKFSQEKSLHIKTGSGEGVTITGLRIPVTSEENYSAYAKCYLNNGTVTIGVQFLKDDLTPISLEDRQISNSFKTWSDLGVRSVSPTEAAYAILQITAEENTDCYLDELYLGNQFSYKGVPLKLDYLQAGAVSKDSDGNDYLYTVVADESANKLTSFVAVDLATKKTVKEIIMPTSSGSFNMVTGKDNNVYVASQPDGKIYKYIPGSDELIDLGTAVPGETHIFGLDVASDGKIYGGTYPNCYAFVYDPAVGSFKTFGPNGEGQPFDKEEMYGRSVAYDEENDAVYIGVGTHAKLYRYDFKTGITKSVLPDKYKNESYIYTMKFYNGKLFAFASPGGDLLVMSFDEEGNATVENTLRGSAAVTKPVDGKSYYINSNKTLTAYEYDTNTSIPVVDEEGEQKQFIQSPVMVDIVQLKDQENYPGWTYISLAGSTQRLNRYIAYNLTTHKMEILELELPGKNYNPRSLMSGPDGKIYAGNHLGGGTSSYDPVTNKNELFYGLAQPESGVSLDGKMYFSCYTQAKIYEYDPSKDWEYNYTIPVNPKEIYRLGPNYEQDRPFGSASGDGLLFVGTVPEYGKLGGTISIYNPKTGEFPYVLRNVVQDQSVTALAYHDGILYGGTSVWGGIGAVPTQTEAKFFAFDVATKTKLFEKTIAQGKRTITTVEVGPDGKIWGMAEGYLFKYNPKTEEIEFNEETFPEINFSAITYSNPRLYGAQLVAGNDGYMYGNTSGKLFKINPKTMETIILKNSSSIFIAKDFFSNIYYTDFIGTWKYSGFDSDDVIINQVELWVGRDTAKINGMDIHLDAAPTIENDRTLVPARFIVEAFKGNVSWDEETQSGELSIGENKIIFKLNSNVLLVNGEEVKIDTPVKTINDRTVLPLRAFLENLDMSVDWDENSQKITVY